jgi:peptidoglycan/LPS O-acetylase OafA/YrhL
MYKNLLFPGFGPFYIFNLWQFSAAFMLMAIILVRPEIQKLLSFRPLVVLGGLSFSLYLTHYLILHTIGDWLYVNIRPTYGISIAVIGAVFSTIIISIAVSFVWKKYIDDMSVSVSRQFAKYILK